MEFTLKPYHCNLLSLDYNISVALLYGDRKNGGKTITYGRNHMIAWFKPSCGRWTYVVKKQSIILWRVGFVWH